MKNIVKWILICIPAFLFSGCFVGDKTETDLVISYAINHVLPIDITENFDETTTIKKEDFTKDLDIPEGARVKKLDVEYLAAQIVALPGNTASKGVSMELYSNDFPFFTQKETLGFSSDLTVIHNLNATALIDFKDNLLRYVDEDPDNDEDIVIKIQGSPNPANERLRSFITIRLQGAVTVGTELF